MASEKIIERFCVEEAKRRGGQAVKGTAANTKGFPDRTILLPGGTIGFLELKGSSGRVTRLQEHWINKLRGLGFKAEVANSKEAVKEFLDSLC